MVKFSGIVCIRFIAADPAAVITKLALTGVYLLDMYSVDPMTTQVSLYNYQLSIAVKTLEQLGIQTEVLRKLGLIWRVKKLISRPILAGGLILYLIIASLIPNRILFIEIQGNKQIPDKKILYYAQECGVTLASSASSVRSESIKNQIMEYLPDLQWVGINTNGCVATIHVMERSETEGRVEHKSKVSSIVAAHDGLIAEIIVKKGTPLFSVGQQVMEGDILVSGYTDCGLKLLAENADAEVFAYTSRENHVVALLPNAKRSVLLREHNCIKVKIGKKVINLCNHSGIPDASCVKMYSEDFCLFPRSFLLPVSILKDRYLIYQYDKNVDATVNENSWIPSYVRYYLQSQMIAGQILSECITLDCGKQACRMIGQYDCYEMIGRVKYEEIIGKNAKDN